jgi:hypothetical protein
MTSRVLDNAFWVTLGTAAIATLLHFLQPALLPSSYLTILYVLSFGLASLIVQRTYA